MKRDAAEILKDALALPTEARAALAGSLLESLDTEVGEDAEAAWASVGASTAASLNSKPEWRPIPWADVRRRLAQR
jgi:putative addiction module component